MKKIYISGYLSYIPMSGTWSCRVKRGDPINARTLTGHKKILNLMAGHCYEIGKGKMPCNVQDIRADVEDKNIDYVLAIGFRAKGNPDFIRYYGLIEADPAQYRP